MVKEEMQVLHELEISWKRESGSATGEVRDEGTPSGTRSGSVRGSNKS